MLVADPRLGRYGDLAVRVGLNLQPGQRLLIIGSLASGGTPLDAAPVVRAVAGSAYRAGASLVETLWGDEALQRLRFRHAPRDTFDEFSAWFPDALARHAEAGGAILSLWANDPDLLRDEPPDLVAAVQQATARHMRAFRDLVSRNETNWAVIAAPSAAWAARVFPDLPESDRIPRLWEIIVRLCRLDAGDPVAAWEAHLAALAARCADLNGRRFHALHFRAPDTDLLVGLPPAHRWVSGRSTSRRGIAFTANLPTEEIFTIADRARVSGTVRSTKALSYGGTLIEDFSLTFRDGRVTAVSAARGEAVLRQLVSTDEGAGRLGEVALVPHASPVAQSNLLFYQTLFDENAASHVALGSAYRFTLDGGDTMSADAFEQAGGNRSGIHVDFMIGSGLTDVDGVDAAGTPTPLMRAGEWV